jgi:DNA-binding NtrC family response regulator
MGSDYSDQPTEARRIVAPVPLASPFVLTVIEGPDRTKQFTVEPSHPGRILIGKSEACDVQLTDPAVSRRHCAVEVVGHRLRLTDLGSTNGTVVDGVALLAGFLSGDEIMRVGSTALKVETGEPRPISATAPRDAFGTTLGTSETMRRLYPLCERLASSKVPVVIEGETGVGKEQLAESLHGEGPRSDAPFVVFDCTAVAPNLIESELFGHERGAFTGSITTHRGVFELADGGTLFIDEIGDMPLDLQPKLLRAIERLQVKRVGAQSTLSVDVRVIAATRRDLDREVQLGRFRDDLFHRLAVARVELPPLRERRGDIGLLARHFWQEFGGELPQLPRDLLRSWEDYAWPGNVRELRNAVARRIALGELGAELIMASTPGVIEPLVGHGDPIAAVLTLDLPLSDARHKIQAEFERRYVTHLLEQHDGNVTRAAAAAGITRRQLQRLKGRMRDDDEVAR